MWCIVSKIYKTLKAFSSFYPSQEPSPPRFKSTCKTTPGPYPNHLHFHCLRQSLTKQPSPSKDYYSLFSSSLSKPHLQFLDNLGNHRNSNSLCTSDKIKTSENSLPETTLIRSQNPNANNTPNKFISKRPTTP